MSYTCLDVPSLNELYHFNRVDTMDSKTVSHLSQSEKDVPIEQQVPSFEIPKDMKQDDELVIKMMTEKNNPFGLSPQERRVIYHWQKSGNQTEAYKKVMLSPYDRQAISTSALRKRVMRFYNTYRIREAMAATPGERGRKAREDFIKWRQKQQTAAIAKFTNTAKKIGLEINQEFTQPEQEDTNYNDIEQDYLQSDDQDTTSQDSQNDSQDSQTNYSSEHADTVSQTLVDRIVETISAEVSKEQKQPIYNDTSPAKFTPAKSDKDLWIESLNISKDPTAMTIYGTGQFLAYIAVKEIMDRQRAIKDQHKDVLSRDGSALTPNIINAIKTAAAMILPFAPAPSAEDRREMSKAAVLLGLIPDRIDESPDAYTAPPPITVDVTQGD